ncbi:MAG: four helix bundle protein [bacterium]|nr:four helix bundle protein [bacterium]
MTKSENPIKDKAYLFAKEMVFLHKRLSSEKEFVLSKQVLKSGTSIGANIEEAQQSQSRNDFLSKMQIALKEAYETRYWISLLGDTGYIPKENKEQYLKYITEIIKILAVIVSRTRHNAKLKK